MTKTKAVLKNNNDNKAMENFIVTHPRLTRLVVGIGIFGAFTTLSMLMLSDSFLQLAFAWQPVSNHTIIA